MELIDMTEDKMLELWDKSGGDIYAYADLVADKEREACTAHAITAAEKAIDVAIKLEREACAKVCETHGVHPALNVWNGGPDWYKHGKDCATAIRARGQE